MQGFIEPILFLTAFALLWRERRTALPPSHNTILLIMVLISVVSQLVLFFLVIPTYGEVKLPLAVSLLLPLFYTFEVYVITRLALIYTSRLPSGGFAWLKSRGLRSLEWLWMGITGGLITAGLIIVYSVAYGHRFFPEQPLLLMAFGTAFSNLAREEVLFRLGAQTIILKAFKGHRSGTILAAVGSAALFEMWHNPMEAWNGLNFLISLAYAMLYHRWGYEAAAIAHALGDLAALWALPLIWGHI